MYGTASLRRTQNTSRFTPSRTRTTTAEARNAAGEAGPEDLAGADSDMRQA